MTPVDFSTLFEKTDTRLPSSGKPFLYTRLGNPTRLAVETQISSIFGLQHCVVTTNSTSAYYSLSLNYSCQSDGVVVVSQRQAFKSNIRKIFGSGPQAFDKVEYEEEIPHEVRDGVKLVIVEMVLPKSGRVITNEELIELCRLCRAKEAQLVVDFTTAYHLLKTHKFEENFDYIIADLSYFAGIECNQGAAILSHNQPVF